MLELEIKGCCYKVRFGVGFVRALDEQYFVTNNAGTKFGMGLSQKIPSLIAHDPVVLAEFLYLGTRLESTCPTQAEIDDYIDTCPDIDGLYDRVLDELKKSNAAASGTKAAEASYLSEEQKQRDQDAREKKLDEELWKLHRKKALEAAQGNSTKKS